MLKQRVPAIDRFTAKYIVNKETGCWEWTARKNACGYGTLKVDGKSWLAHRWIYKNLHGIENQRLCVCHKCDNPACVGNYILDSGGEVR